MTTTIYTNSGNYSPITLSPGEFAYVPQGVVVGVSGQVDPITMGGDALVQIDGTLSAQRGIFTTPGSTNNVIQIGATGRLVTPRFAAATSSGADLAIYNDGRIDTGYILAQADTDLVIANTGTIRANQLQNLAAFALIDAGAGGGGNILTLTNSGLIQSAQGRRAILGGTLEDVVTNTGRIVGAVSLNAGNDHINTSGGTIQGAIDLGAGADTAYGSAAADTILGGTENDLIRGNGGKDALDGGSGTDTLDYREKTTAVVLTLNGANAVTVTVNGVAEDSVKNFERVLGGSGSDRFTGDAGANRLEGYKGNDVLAGSSSNDTLVGGDGNDTLSGGTGNDSLIGGAGADHFRFREAAISGNRDTITDFVHLSDKIILEDAIFTALGTSVTSDEFVAKASGNAATNSSQHLIYDKATGRLWYDADGVGGAAPVQIAQLGTTASHPTNLTWQDFGIV